MRDPHLKRCFIIALVFTGALWAIQVAASLLGLPLSGLGIRPATWAGLHGVATAPLAHGSFRHLAANTPPLLVLGTAMLYGFPRASRIALPAIWLGSGAAVWLFARDATHLGASGLTYGMMFFVFAIGVLRRDRPSIALALIVAFLYGGMVWGVLPIKPGVSFESHLSGAILGIAMAAALRRRDPLAGRRRYDWEEEPALADDDPVIGDLWRDAEAPEVPARRYHDNDEQRQE